MEGETSYTAPRKELNPFAVLVRCQAHKRRDACIEFPVAPACAILYHLLPKMLHRLHWVARRRQAFHPIQI